MSGICALSKTIQLYRGEFPLQSDFSPVYDRPQVSYNAQLDQVKRWAESISQKTLLVYSEADHAVDTNALAVFAAHLKSAEVVVFPKNEGVKHTQTMLNYSIGSTGKSNLQLMQEFISEID